ncbi:tRNA lysidine(34) synthetase TilS [Marinomonas ostreistagni]|uniref:tRNA lysidine(34) synthetase TilS n=1 Tax=Marinomonas ostreistagni TaxID=359209 RepID=UPI00194E5D5C|nr:tRNA lysidine(34) synthetase TilS [Marinomonas ostreistagni]MBM6551327.1 tRNA lysidine(34) synthetase TilS [Marinomonas ostreistagni]
MIDIDFERIECLLGAHGKVWVALSGGVDSMVLLYLLTHQAPSTLRQRVMAVHVHHGLSEQADAWLRHCQQVCADWQIPFVSECVQVEQGASVEDQARQKRYQVFEQYVQAGDVLLQGHHANDQAETLLFRLERGCGWRGIQGIPEHRELGDAVIVRPLLNTPRAQIEAFARQHHVSWVEDESNDDARFRRNFLRHQVLAPWQHNNGQVVERIAQSVTRLQSEAQVLERLVQDSLAGFIDADGGLLLTKLPEDERGFWLTTYLAQQGIGVTQHQQAALVQMFFSHQAKRPQYQSADYRLIRFQDVLYVLPKAQIVSEQTLAADTWLERPFDRLYCDQTVLIRSRPEGIQLRMNNGRHRPLKKWLQDQKIPSWWREQLPYIFCDQTLVAIGDLWQHPDWQGKVIWQRNGALVWPSNT